VGVVGPQRAEQANAQVPLAMQNLLDAMILKKHEEMVAAGTPELCQWTSYAQMARENPECIHNFDEMSMKGKQVQGGRVLVAKSLEVRNQRLPRSMFLFFHFKTESYLIAVMLQPKCFLCVKDNRARES